MAEQREVVSFGMVRDETYNVCTVVPTTGPDSRRNQLVGSVVAWRVSEESSESTPGDGQRAESPVPHNMSAPVSEPEITLVRYGNRPCQAVSNKYADRNHINEVPLADDCL